MIGIHEYNKAGEQVNPGELATAQRAFEAMGSLTAVEAVLAVDERTRTVLDALIASGKAVKVAVPEGKSYAEFRFRQTNTADSGENDAYTIEQYRGHPGEDIDVNRIATLTLTVGQQDANSGGHFIDTIVASNETFLDDWVVVNSAGDSICTWYGDMVGIKYIYFIMSAKQGTAGEAIYVEARFL